MPAITALSLTGPQAEGTFTPKGAVVISSGTSQPLHCGGLVPLDTGAPTCGSVSTRVG